MKRTTAQMLGATHVYSSMEEALPELAALTWGRLADKVIITVGEMRADLLAPAMALAGKDGTVVVTAMGSTETQPVPFSFFDLTMWNKSILGCLYGSRDPRVSVNQLLGLYTDGILKLDELITKTYPLSRVNDAIQAMLDGEVIRAVLTFDS
jgi:S-(hydroxymethyl)glutathione dehydrogenase/alcohol dehydrogenase